MQACLGPYIYMGCRQTSDAQLAPVLFPGIFLVGCRQQAGSTRTYILWCILLVIWLFISIYSVKSFFYFVTFAHCSCYKWTSLAYGDLSSSLQ